MLHLAMSVFSPVRDVRMVLNKSTGETRGFAFVHFYSVAEASRVMEVMQVGRLLPAVLRDICRARLLQTLVCMWAACSAAGHLCHQLSRAACLVIHVSVKGSCADAQPWTAQVTKASQAGHSAEQKSCQVLQQACMLHMMCMRSASAVWAMPAVPFDSKLWRTAGEASGWAESAAAAGLC